MFQTDASYYLGYFESYPNPSLTNSSSDITTGKYGLGASAMTSNPSWRVYAGKLGLGQAIFEASGWSGAYAYSVLAPGPTSWEASWFMRGGQGSDTTVAGVESLSIAHGHPNPGNGNRCIVRVWTPAPSVNS